MPLMRVLLLLVRVWVRVLMRVLLHLLRVAAELIVRRRLLREPVREVRPSGQFSAARGRRLERRARVGRAGNLVGIHWGRWAGLATQEAKNASGYN